MKVLVVYDSVYGNTEKIAKATGEALTGEIKVLRIGEANLSDLEKVDLLVMGSPTQGGRATKPIQEFLDKIPDTSIKGVRFASFDTRLSTRFVGIFGYAAGRISNTLKNKGGTLVTAPQAFFVKGTQGPLKDGELERAATWAKSLISS
jgi:flavodoxin I